MNKFFITVARYNGEKQQIFDTYISPRNKTFCEKHNYKYIEILNHHSFNFSRAYNHHFYRWWIIKDAIDNNKIVDGDIILHHDADILIVNLDKDITVTKSMTYAIDTANTHIAGLFYLKINPFTRKLIDLYINNTNIERAQHIKVWNENSNQYEIMGAHDQHMFYHYMGIKMHSWKSFYNLPNYGFHSNKTELTCFELDEIIENIEILPTEWNVTVGPDNPFFINPNNHVINRHFAGGQPWVVKQYLNIL